MLRVLTLSTLFPDASRPDFGVFVEKQTRGLAARADVQLQVVAPLGLPPKPFSAAPRYRALDALPLREAWRGLDVHRPRFINLPGTSGRFHAPMLTRALIPLLTEIRRTFPFDVVDAEFFFPDGPVGIALGRRFDVPVSIKARGADIHHWGRSPATALAVAGAAREAEGVLAVSRALRDDMIALGMPGERIAVHRTGVDHGAFAAHERAAAKAALGIDGPLVLAVGSLIARKGHDIVIDAVASLPGVALHIVGGGSERAALEARIGALGASDRIRLIGQVPHEELPRIFAAADVMALASASEGLANVWVEALAAGTPVVAPDIGGAAEAIDRPEAGRLVARTPEAFAAAIAALLHAPPSADAVRAAAQRFSWQTNTIALKAHLDALVAAHAGAQALQSVG
jgi:glycosyltransferase involved in cell wall biosynthesis